MFLAVKISVKTVGSCAMWCFGGRCCHTHTHTHTQDTHKRHTNRYTRHNLSKVVMCCYCVAIVLLMCC
jgi:hypothetical protein